MSPDNYNLTDATVVEKQRPAQAQRKGNEEGRKASWRKWKPASRNSAFVVLEMRKSLLGPESRKDHSKFGLQDEGFQLNLISSLLFALPDDGMLLENTNYLLHLLCLPSYLLNYATHPHLTPQ